MDLMTLETEAVCRDNPTKNKNKPGLRLNLVLLKLVFKWHAETWFKLSLDKLSLDKLGLFKTGLNRFKLSLRGKSNTFTHFSPP